MAYSEKVMDHFMNPRNVGVMPDADGVGEVGNAKCGDIMKIFIKVKDNIITDISFQTFGCGAAIATSSMATELAKGKSVEEALELTNLAVAEALDGLPPTRCIVPTWQLTACVPRFMTIRSKTVCRPKVLKCAAAAATTAVTDSCFTVKIFHLQPLLLFTLVLQKSRWLAPSAFLW